MGNMRAALRVSIGFGFVSVLLIAGTALGIGRMAQIKGSLDGININNVQSKLVSEMYLTVTERALAMRNLILLTDENEIRMEIQRIKDQTEKYAAAEKTLSLLFASLPDVTAEEKAKLAQIKEVATASGPFIDTATALALAKRGEDSYQLLRFDFRPTQKKWWSLLRELIELEEQRNKNATIEADQAYNHGYRLMLAFGSAALLLSITAAWLITRAEKRLQESHTQLHALSVHREVVQEEERKNIARELHDELGQILTALHMQISVVRLKFGKDNPALAEHAQALTKMVDSTMQVIRRMVTSLRPAALEMGIASAMEWLADEFTRHSGIGCKLAVEEKEVTLDEKRAVAIFRIVQESLTNVARHAQASLVEVSLKRQDAHYFLQVRDNGKGFDPDVSKPNSFGLAGVRERVLALGGTIAVTSAPGQGSSLGVHLPIEDIASCP